MAKTPTKGRIRLVADIEENLFKEAKKSTVERNCTMTKWVTRAIIKQLKYEKLKNER